MKQKRLLPRVVFNASVLLSALHSPNGGSGELLKLIRRKQLRGIVSETILDEALKHANKIPLTREQLQKEIKRYFPVVLLAPQEKTVSRYLGRMLDHGDTHLFATCEESHATHLVSLDKHHILVLQGKIPHLSIVSPAQLLNSLK